MIYYLAHSDIQSTAFELAIAKEISQVNNFIYLTATQNLKKMRADSPTLSQGFIPYKDSNALANLYSITDLIQYVSKQTYESKEYLSNADQRFILAKTIGFYYAENPAMRKTMYQMRYDLQPLFSLLSFHNKKIEAEQLETIGKDFSCVEKDIFGIYATYQSVIAKLLAYIECGQGDDMLIDVLGENFLKNTRTAKVKEFAEKQKEIVLDLISKTDALFFDGFLFFNEMQRYIFSSAVREGKSVYFISKQFNDDMGKFFFEHGIKEIAEKLSVDIKIIDTPDEKVIGKTALDYIKTAFPLSIDAVPVNAQELINDGTIKFISPFITREEELRYVAKSISRRLKEAYTGDINEIVRMLNNDIAIVLAIDKENYEERISNIFREIGLFVFKNELLEKSAYSDIDIDSFESVYFNRQEFLGADIKWSDGKSLSYQDKHIVFMSCFMRIDINRSVRPIASYPVGQFVLELYRTINEGMSIEGFKGILYSNWRYTVDKVQLRWSDFISDFKYIEIFFENSKDITKWRDTANELLLLKKETVDNPFLVYHPLTQIKNDSMEFFAIYLTNLQT